MLFRTGLKQAMRRWRIGMLLYLTAVINWFSSYLLSWRFSNAFEVRFSVEALEA